MIGNETINVEKIGKEESWNKLLSSQDQLWNYLINRE